MAARFTAERGGARTLGELHAADLYLAFGCARGDAEAIAAFEAQVLARVRIRARKMEADFDEETRQAVRERLLVAPPGASPRIEEYSGRGPLLSWVQGAAARTALNLREKAQGRPEQPEAELPAVASPNPTRSASTCSATTGASSSRPWRPPSPASPRRSATCCGSTSWMA